MRMTMTVKFIDGLTDGRQKNSPFRTRYGTSTYGTCTVPLMLPLGECQE